MSLDRFSLPFPMFTFPVENDPFNMGGGGGGGGGGGADGGGGGGGGGGEAFTANA